MSSNTPTTRKAPPAGVADHLAAIHDPAHLPVAAADPVLELVVILGAAQDLLLAPARRFAVVGMDKSQPGFERGRGIAGIGAKDAQELRRTQRAVVGNVVFVRAELRGLGRGAKLLFAAAQRRRTLLEVAAGAPQRVVDGVDLPHARIADDERLAAAQRTRRGGRGGQRPGKRATEQEGQADHQAAHQQDGGAPEQK